MVNTADRSFPDFRSPFPVPGSPFPLLVTSLSESTINETSRKEKATLQGSERRERENSNQAESFQNQQTEASLFNNKKKILFHTHKFIV